PTTYSAMPSAPRPEQRRLLRREGRQDRLRAEDLVERLLEAAEVFLPEPPLSQRPAFLGQELRRDPRALRGQDLDPVPGGRRVVPDVEEPPPLAPRRREGDQP